jgi:hypothetical protein
MSDEISVLGSVELDGADGCDPGGRRGIVVVYSDELAALLYDLETYAFDQDFILGGCGGGVRGHGGASMLLDKVQHSTLLHVLSLEALLALGLFDSGGAGLRVLLKDGCVDQLQMTIGLADPRPIT